MHRLREAHVPSHTLAAELLLMHVTGRDRAWLYAHPEETLPAQTAEDYAALVERRAAGTPTQYLTGKQEFWGLEFEVRPAVLIPRPETEHVVEVALERLGPRTWSRSRGPGPPVPSGPAVDIADVGTGSGCLAVALAHELPQARVVATDISAAALEIARRNATRHNVADRIEFLECNLLDSVLGSSPVTHHSSLFDLIVSNPPYIGRAELETLPREVREHEPREALWGGEQGYEFYTALVLQAHQVLRPGGLLVLELGYNSFEFVDGLLEAARGWMNVRVNQDLAGIARVISAERN